MVTVGFSLIFVSLILLLLCPVVSFTSFPAEKVSKDSDGYEDCDGQDCSEH